MPLPVRGLGFLLRSKSSYQSDIVGRAESGMPFTRAFRL